MELEKLRARFEAKYVRGEPDECWEWRGYRDRQGYGRMRLLGEQVAARISYRLYRGDIPTGLVILHLCDNPPCVNPGHLRVGTIGGNNKDRAAKGRNAPRRPGGHNKLTDSQVREIRERYEAGERQYALADEYGVNQSNISRIVRQERLAAVS
ncbi:hypothetical protein DQP57_00325 [Mycobacterium colombiense]|uniref:HNH nuclease domain-containing protein n=1 Tax=Mycobacterium colombiense TaxID=339268 RepID=A0A329MBQ3_9MYCO|nr:HNH endonuclease [Mycobacterium colombiense]RAV17505.1 hypothetical protein DQP57_00325 [Mycobacterium colombiense]